VLNFAAWTNGMDIFSNFYLKAYVYIIAALMFTRWIYLVCDSVLLLKLSYLNPIQSITSIVGVWRFGKWVRFSYFRYYTYSLVLNYPFLELHNVGLVPQHLCIQLQQILQVRCPSPHHTNSIEAVNVFTDAAGPYLSNHWILDSAPFVGSDATLNSYYFQ